MHQNWLASQESRFSRRTVEAPAHCSTPHRMKTLHFHIALSFQHQSDNHIPSPELQRTLSRKSLMSTKSHNT